ncbi:Leucine Rich repeats (2 copies) [compost metagenome]
MLGKLERLQYFSITSKKPVSLSFISNFKELQYLSVHGKFLDLTPIGDATWLDTLILSTTIHELDFVRQLPKLECLFIHDCTLEGSLAALADSTVTMLSLASIRNLTELDVIASMHNLTCLRLSLPKVESLCDFSKLHNLRQLELDNMKALKHIDLLWTAQELEMLELREISTTVKAKDLEPLIELKHLQQLDFQFIDFNKGRIATLREWFAQAGKEYILYENIADDQRRKSMSLVHLQKHLGLAK